MGGSSCRASRLIDQYAAWRNPRCRSLHGNELELAVALRGRNLRFVNWEVEYGECASGRQYSGHPSDPWRNACLHRYADPRFGVQSTFNLDSSLTAVWRLLRSLAGVHVRA